MSRVPDSPLDSRSPSPPSFAPGIAPELEPCEYCGVAALEWRKCKLICTNCRQINKSCADL